MTKDNGPGKLPSFARKPSGMLSKEEAGISEKARLGADAATDLEAPDGVIAAQHCSHPGR